MLEQVRSLLLEHNNVWFTDDTPFRTLMYQYSTLINRLNNAVQSDKVPNPAEQFKNKVPRKNQ